MKKILLLTVIVFAAIALYGQPTVPTLDPSFANGGIFRLTHGPDTLQKETMSRVLFLPDGKLLVAGSAVSESDEGALFGIRGLIKMTRYNPDGSPDNTFADSGTKAMKPLYWPLFWDIAAASDGRIAFDCLTTAPAVCLNADGDFSNLFRLPNDCDLPALVLAMAFQGDGKLLMAGYIESEHTFLCRFEKDGTLDNSFGQNGVVHFPHQGILIGKIRVFDNGKIMLAFGHNWEESHSNEAFARLLPDGSLDTTFGDGGFVEYEGSKSDFDLEFALVGANTVTLNLRGGAIVRLLPDGLPDPSFGIAGTVDYQNLYVRRLAVQPDGKVLLSGRRPDNLSGNDRAFLWRFDASGAMDTIFNQRTDSLFALSDFKNVDLSVGSGGEIALVCSDSKPASEWSDVWRLTSEGLPDPAFGADGHIFTHPSKENSKANDLKIQAADGKIVALGNLDHSGMLLARLHPNGAPDASFGNSGLVWQPVQGGNPESWRQVELVSGGKILAAGQTHDLFDDNSPMLRKFLNNGSPDVSFGNAGQVRLDDAGNLEKMAVQSSGNILLAVSEQPKAQIFGFLPNGQQNLVFGQNGKLELFDSSQNVQLAVLSDDRFLLAWQSPDYNWYLSRLKPNGGIENFGIKTATPSEAGCEKALLKGMKVRSDGKILLWGTCQDGNNVRVQFVRLNPNGSKDLSFGTSGTVVLPEPWSAVAAVHFRPDGQMDVSGSFSGCASEFLFENPAFARLQDDGQFDASFGTDGSFFYGLHPAYNLHTAAVWDNDGQGITLAGRFSEHAVNFTVARFGYQTVAVEIPGGNVQPNARVFPNPIEGETATMEYSLPMQGKTTVQLFDLQGRLLQAFLRDEHREAGQHHEMLQFPAGLSQGVYMLMLSTENGLKTIKVVR